MIPTSLKLLQDYTATLIALKAKNTQVLFLDKETIEEMGRELWATSIGGKVADKVPQEGITLFLNGYQIIIKESIEDLIAPQTI